MLLLCITLTFFFFDFLLAAFNFLYRFSLDTFLVGGGGDDNSSPADGDVPSPGQIPSANFTDFLFSLTFSPPSLIFNLLQKKQIEYHTFLFFHIYYLRPCDNKILFPAGFNAKLFKTIGTGGHGPFAFS